MAGSRTYPAGSWADPSSSRRRAPIWQRAVSTLSSAWVHRLVGLWGVVEVCDAPTTVERRHFFGLVSIPVTLMSGTEDRAWCAEPHLPPLTGPDPSQGPHVVELNVEERAVRVAAEPPLTRRTEYSESQAAVRRTGRPVARHHRRDVGRDRYGCRPPGGARAVRRRRAGGVRPAPRRSELLGLVRRQPLITRTRSGEDTAVAEPPGAQASCRTWTRSTLRTWGGALHP